MNYFLGRSVEEKKERVVSRTRRAEIEASEVRRGEAR
jgi:hypothetical protein